MADSTRHVLVVAGRTARSAALREVLLARAAAGPAEFTLLVPDADGEEGGGPPQRLLDAVEQLRAAGLDVAGQLGDPDPLLAVSQVWDPYEFDEVVVSTYPPGRSQWLALDLPGRVERVTGVEVRRVVADR